MFVLPRIQVPAESCKIERSACGFHGGHWLRTPWPILCLYRVQKFDSDSERIFAVVLENDREVLKWFKPAKGSFQIHYASDASYEPDFVVETRTAKFLCEPKAATDLAGEEVQAKARAAAEWCRQATAHERKHGGRPFEVVAEADCNSRGSAGPATLTLGLAQE